MAFQDCAVLLLEDGASFGVLAVLMGLSSLSDVSIDMRGAPHALQGAAGLLHLAALDQGVGGVRDDEAAKERMWAGKTAKSTDRCQPTFSNMWWVPWLIFCSRTEAHQMIEAA